MTVNGNAYTKCPDSEDQKHAFEQYSITGVPQCSNCGVLVDKY